MPRKEHRYHFVYKTTCLVNDRYYIGMHSTSDLDDGYIGSGKRLRNSIRSHGKENHKMVILEFLSDRSTLKTREKEIVNEKLLDDPLCMNLTEGGEGGWTKEAQKKGAKTTNSILWKDPEFREKMTDVSSKTMKKLWADPEKSKKLAEAGANSFLGRKHKKESLDKMSKAASMRTGKRNNQYGKVWIHNKDQKESRIVKKEDLNFYTNCGWEIGRKMKF